MSNTTDNFWSVFGTPEPEVEKIEPSYRLYHDDNGCPLFYSMEDLPGNYIEVDQETFSHSPSRVRVRDGKLLKVTVLTSTKLIPGDTGVACDPSDICIVVDESLPNIKWSVRNYESY
jgi:hypothetical protein